MATSPEGREAQRLLAVDVTTRVHGEAAALEAVAVSRRCSSGSRSATRRCWPSVFAATGGATVTPDDRASGAAVLLAETGLAPSRGEARRLVQGGAITVNGVRITDPAAALPEAIAGEWLEVRVGKRNRSVVRIAPG